MERNRPRRFRPGAIASDYDRFVRAGLLGCGDEHAPALSQNAGIGVAILAPRSSGLSLLGGSELKNVNFQARLAIQRSLVCRNEH